MATPRLTFVHTNDRDLPPRKVRVLTDILLEHFGTGQRSVRFA
jgi:hypothetical protein